MQVLIVDDTATSRLLLIELVTRLELEPVVYSDPQAVAAEIDRQTFDLALVDHVMPAMSGTELVRCIRTVEMHRTTPIIVVTAAGERQTRLAAIKAGATDFLSKPLDAAEFGARVRNLIELRKAQVALSDRATMLSDEVAEATRKLMSSERDVIQRLARAIEFRDGQTGLHVSRMAEICRLIAEGLGLDQDTCQTIHLAAPLHDVGKVGVPDTILRKRGRLTAPEVGAMRQHVQYGEEILQGGDSALLQAALEIAAGHHERWDGNGYPRGLAREHIPLKGRIAAVADVFEALISERPYKSAMPVEQARAYVVENAGSQFDPACVQAFEKRWPDIMAVVSRR